MTHLAADRPHLPHLSRGGRPDAARDADKRGGVGTRLRVAVAVGWAASRLSRLSGLGSGGVIGGRTLLRIAPDAVARLAAGRQVLLVSGTNGKTTTTALLTAALRSCSSTDSNADGANTPAGLVQGLTGDAGTVVLETDEAWLPWTVDRTRPAVVVLLNLTRDQLDRHHEVGRVAGRWRQGLGEVDLVVANVDDPDVVWAAMAAHRQVWVACGRRWGHDDAVCPSCGGEVAHAEDGWSCECGLRRPRPDWWLEGSDLVSRERRVPLRLNLPGPVNLVNAAMAVAAASALEVPPRVAAQQMTKVTTAAGRYEVIEHEGRSARMLLAKNPAGWLETVSMVADSQAPVVLAFNSEGVDGRDPSWLYDVDFTALRGRRLVLTGRRATDLAVRLHLDGVQRLEQFPDVRTALASVPAGPVDVVANYTAFQDARKALARARR
ncbi:MurT ligase domain-containing protein [Nocardioides korecus]